MENASIVASVVSVILGFFAIWLSATFYRMSTKIAESIKEAAKGISSGVERLEKLFDTLYADTFTMMKETVSDMRRHIWPETTPDGSQLIEQKADEKISQLRAELAEELSKIVSRTDRKVGAVRSEIEALVDSAITRSRKVEKEVIEETLRNSILNIIYELAEKGLHINAGTVLDNLQAQGVAPGLAAFTEELYRLHEEGVLTLPKGIMSPDDIGAGSRILLRGRARS